MDNLRPVGPLARKWRQLVGKAGELCVESWHLQGCSSDLWQLRTDGLAPVSKYWTYRSHAGDMGPVSLVAYCRQMFGFLYCFIGWIRSETRYGPTDWTAGVLWIVSGALFLRINDFVQLCRWLVKGCYTWTKWDTYGQGPYANRACKTCGMLVRFFPAWCTSIRIARTLGYEYRLFVAVIT
jgi:hypothetical protein